MSACMSMSILESICSLLCVWLHAYSIIWDQIGLGLFGKRDQIGLGLFGKRDPSLWLHAYFISWDRLPTRPMKIGLGLFGKRDLQTMYILLLYACIGVYMPMHGCR